MTTRKRSRSQSTNHTAPKPVILDHDGGVDDLVALALLLANPEKVKVIGCVVLDADCYVKDAYSCSGKLAALVRRKSGNKVPAFPIAKSTLSGVHPFPHEWRVDAKKMDDLPCLNIPQYCDGWEAEFGSDRPGQDLLADLVMNSDAPVSLCVTGPLTNVAYCLEKHGEPFAKRIGELVIMGGAVDVEGNAFEKATDRSAEWNIYWDAPSAKKVLESPLLSDKVRLFSLDATNHVPVTSDVVQRFGAMHDHLMAVFIGSGWAQCTFLHTDAYGLGYFAWDVLTAAFVVEPDFIEMEPIPVRVHDAANTPSEGRTERHAEGVVIQVAKTISVERFYSLVFAAAAFV